MLIGPYHSYFNRPAPTLGGVNLPPSFDELIQWLGKTFTSGGLWYQEDQTGVREGEVLLGSYLDFNTVDNVLDYNFKPITGTTYAEFEMDVIRTDGDLIGVNNSLDPIEDNFGLIWFNTDNKIYLVVSAGVTMVAEFTDALTGYSNTPVHVKGIYDGSQPEGSRIKIWVDDVLQVLDTVGVVGTSFQGTAVTNFISGSYTGIIENSRIISSSIKIGTDPTSVYPIDEKDGDTVFDVSGNDNHGTLLGVLTSIWQEDASATSYNNEFGYNEGGVSDQELITNGDFDSGTTGWTPRAATTILSVVDGKMRVSVSGHGFGYAYQSFPTEIGKTYSGSCDISNIVNSARITVGTAAGSSVNFDQTGITDDGTYPFEFVATATSTFISTYVFADTDSADWDNISIKEVFPSTVFIPADQTDLNIDAIGNTLLNKGKVRYDAQLVGSNMLEFNGTNNYIDLGTITRTDNNFSVELKGLYWNTASNNNSFYTEGNDTPAGLRTIFLGADGGSPTLTFWEPDGTAHNYDISNAVPGNQDFDLKITYDGANVKVYKDDVEEYDFPATYNIAKPTNSAVEMGSLSYSIAAYHHFGKLGSIVCDLGEYKCADGSGNIIDSSGNGNHGTPQGTLTNFYSTDDTKRPHNLFDGFTQGLHCDVAGVAYKESNQAYGEWEFDIYKGIDTNQISIPFINDINSARNDGYEFRFTTTEGLFLTKQTGGGTVPLFSTVASYLNNNTHYRIKITRNSVVDEFVTGAIGTFAIYIKGGSFGTDYVPVDVTGGSGTNPVTDNTYTTSAYSLSDLDSGDEISNYKQDDEAFELFDFIQDTGTYSRKYYPIDPTNTGEALTNPGIGNTGQGHNRAETNYLQPEASALIEIANNFSVNPWFDGSNNAIACLYESISFDYEEKHYWFADVTSKYPTKFNWAVYSEQIVEPDLTDVYIFMNSVEALFDINGSPLLDNNDEQLYALVEDLV